MTAPIDVAYVDIVARKESLKKLRDDINKTMDQLERDMEQNLSVIDAQFEDTFDDIDHELHEFEREQHRRFNRIADSVEDAFDDIGTGAGDGLARNFRRLTNQASRFGGILGEALGRLGSMFSSSPLLVTILLLLPAIIALSAALSQLIGVVGLLPTGLSVLLATFIPLVVAFQNFGTAVSALAEGDLEKIDEALKKLSPSAAAVVKEIGQLLPMLRFIQRVVQEAFFSQLRGGIIQFQGLLLTISNGFGVVGNALGSLTRRILDFLALSETSTFIDNLFTTTARIVDKFGPNLERLLIGLLEVANTALPIFERLADTFGDALGRFGDFLAEASRSGELEKFINNAVQTLRELKDLLVSVGGLLKTLFAGTEEAGHGLIVTLTDLTNRFNEFLKSAEGQEFLENISEAVKGTGAILGFLVNIMIGVGNVSAAVENALLFLIASVIKFGQAIKDLMINIKNFFVDGWNEIIEFIESVPGKVEGLKQRFMDAGKNLIQSFMNGFRAVGSFIGDVAGDIVNAVKGFLNKAIDKINTGIASIDKFIPGEIGRIPRLAQGALVHHTPGGILANVGEGREDEVVSPLSKLEDMLGLGGPSLNFGPGAINVSFNGAVPTEEEAFTVGQAVGRGIGAVLARRNVRANVRAI